MHIHNHQIKSEYQQGVLKVLHYINQNLAGDVSLETLARIANYSPFHFQRIFSEVILESPKQYVMRLRLERAAHYLKVFPNLPVVEIGLGCGFSSASIFSRAFKNYYGITAEVFRDMSPNEIATISKQNKKVNSPFLLEDYEQWTTRINNLMENLTRIDISPQPTVNIFNSLTVACVQTTLNHPESILFAFKSLIQWAISNDVATPDSKYIGIWLDAPFYTSADKCRYLAGIELNKEVKFKKGVDIITIKKGQYANFSMIGDLESTLDHLISLNHKYMDELGYEMSEIICYEFFDECPAIKSYDRVSKNILVPVKRK